MVLSLAKEADVDFATMRASVNCVGDASCGGEDLIEALKVVEETSYGQVIFGTIDVANQQDWGRADGNWSKDDIAAASEMSTTIEVLAQTGLDAATAAALASVVSSVADRLAQTGDAWEQLDTDRKWYDHGVGKFAKNFAKAVAIGAVATFAAGFCGVSAGAGCVIAAGMAAGAVTSVVLDGAESKLDGESYGLDDALVSASVGAFTGGGASLGGAGLAATTGSGRASVGWYGAVRENGFSVLSRQNAAWWAQGRAAWYPATVGVRHDLGYGD